MSQIYSSLMTFNENFVKICRSATSNLRLNDANCFESRQHFYQSTLVKTKKRLSFLVEYGVQASKSEFIFAKYCAWRDFLFLIELFRQLRTLQHFLRARVISQKGVFSRFNQSQRRVRPLIQIGNFASDIAHFNLKNESNPIIDQCSPSCGGDYL